MASKRSLEGEWIGAVMELLAGELARMKARRLGGAYSSGRTMANVVMVQGPDSKGPCGPAEKVPLYPDGKKELLKVFKQGCDKVRLVF